MKIEQFVMAYGAEQDRLRALLPDEFSSIRLVLRINAEVRDGKTLPAIPTEAKTVYPKLPLAPENAAKIPCTKVLGSYVVRFEHGSQNRSSELERYSASRT